MLIFSFMKQKKQIIIFTDIDGSLLNRDTFRFDEIEDYFRKLVSKGIKIIPNSSKTEAELLDFNKEYNLNLSFIAENGSSIHRLNLIHKNLPEKVSLGRSTDQIYGIYNENIPYHLKDKITFISRLNSKEQQEIFGLPSYKIKIALERNHSLPIQFNGTESEKNEFINIMTDSGLTIQTGGRIMNICDKTNKSKAMLKTIELIKGEMNDEIITIGVGDNHNDIEMLKNSDYACLVKNDNFDSSLVNIENLIKSSEPSPLGWADVIKTAIQKITFILKLKSKEQKEIFGLPLNKMLLAIKRDHSIPIQFNGTESEKNEFFNIINESGLTIQTGGRIMNICDNTNKSKAMVKTIQLIKDEMNNEIITIGVGDNQNDIEMLKKSDYACLVKNDNFDSSLIDIDNLIKSPQLSPLGWADVIKTAIQKIES